MTSTPGTKTSACNCNQMQGTVLTRRKFRPLIAVLLALDLLVVYATPIEFEVVHEWAGIVAFALVIIHCTINRRWFAALFKGKYRPLRVVSTTLVAAMIACMLALAVSSIIISRHAFGFLPAMPGSSWAREAHLACSSWLFILAFIHSGMHMRLVLPVRQGNVASRIWVAGLAVISVCGILALIALGIPDYLFLQSLFYNGWDGPMWSGVLLYVASAIGMACIGRLISFMLMRRTSSSAC